MSVGPTPGERFGPYDIVGPLGAGGMGVVYRARDSRLGREVALKTLAPGGTMDPVRLQRFEQEARAASALNHPNVLAVFDVGREGDTPFLVTELLEGQTLRERLDDGVIPPRKVLEFATQVAQGLAAVHEKGIVHRDLKPDNVFITKSGQVKILDFGVARTTELATPATGTLPITQSGAVMGTAGYMAPEQVRGKTADARSDLFALGAIVYECLTGQMAFPGETPVERGYAILNADAKDVDWHALGVSPALVKLVQRCLEKEPEQRFQNARDLVFALELAAQVTGSAAPVEAANGWSAGKVAALALGLTAIVVLVAMFTRPPAPTTAQPAPTVVSAVPTIKRVSFRSGSIFTAKFTSDGRGVVYTASFENTPPRIYAGVLDGAELRPAGAVGTMLLDVSSKDDLAIATRSEEAGSKEGMLLSKGSLAGGAPRPLYEGVTYADFGHDDSLVLTRIQDNKYSIEYPPGTVLVTSNAQLARATLSPGGKYIAFERHPVRGDDRGYVEIIDLQGKTIVSGKPAWTLDGLAWSSTGREVWFSAGYEDVSRQVYGIALDGKERKVYGGPTSLRLMDVEESGRMLAVSGIMRSRMFGTVNGEKKEKSLSWLDGSMPLDLSADGKTLLFLEGFGPAGSEVQTWLRRFDGTDDTPVLLGLGWGRALSPDKRWALLSPTPPFNTLKLVSTGAGETRDLRPGPFSSITNVRFFADGQRIAFSAVDETNLPHLYLQNLPTGAPQEGVQLEPVRLHETAMVLAAPPSPDGKTVVGFGKDRKAVLIDVATGEAKPLKDLTVGDFPIQWTPDGKALWVLRRPKLDGPVSVELLRYELATAKTTHVDEFEPPDPVGMHHVKEVVLTPDGKHSVYTANQQLDELFLLEGVR